MTWDFCCFQVPDGNTGNHLTKNTTLAEILTGSEGKTHTELQYAAQEEIGYFSSNGIINVVSIICFCDSKL